MATHVGVYTYLKKLEIKCNPFKTSFLAKNLVKIVVVNSEFFRKIDEKFVAGNEKQKNLCEVL